MNSVNKILCIIITLTLTGCVSLKPAHERNVDRRIFVDESFESVWADTIDWFAATGLGINKIKKESGLISAMPGSVRIGKYLDCGALSSGRYENFTSTLNVVVRKIEPEKTQLTVNVVGNAVAVVRNGYGAILDQKRAPCYSTGELEKSIQNYISRK